MRHPLRQLAAIVSVASIAAATIGCRRSDTPDADALIVYCSVDETFARDILDLYARRTGENVAPVFDSEAGKTTGLVKRIISEAASGRTRADVFWSSELFNTIRLAREDLLDEYDSPAAADIPERFRDPKHRWTALAVRARVITFDSTVATQHPDDPGMAPPMRWEDLAKPKYAPHLSIANPLFGTTQGHVAAMFALWGPQRATDFLRRLRDNGCRIADGNSSAVRNVIAGRSRWAATDTDDVWVAQRSGASLGLVYPDMGDGGTLVIPCSVSILRGGPNPARARRLVDFLVSAEVERMLAESDSRNVPVRASLRESLGVSWPPASTVSYAAIADAMEEASAAVRDILIR